MRRRALVSLLTIACGAPACAEEKPQICDGSDEVRWASHGAFGARDWVPPFIEEYGTGAIRIDGHCQFWLYDTSLRGLRRGVIGASLQRSIEYWSNYGSYASFYDPSSLNVCDDAGGAWVSDGTTTLSAQCISPEAPSGWHRAAASVGYVAGELADIAEYVWRPVQILPLADPILVRNQPVYDWNAPFDLAAHAVTFSFDPALDRGITSIPVDDPAVLARLDELRLMDIEADDAAPGARYGERGLFVRDADGRIFQVFIRDEQPEGLFADPALR